jgi:hypothetical protein
MRLVLKKANTQRVRARHCRAPTKKAWDVAIKNQARLHPKMSWGIEERVHKASLIFQVGARHCRAPTNPILSNFLEPLDAHPDTQGQYALFYRFATPHDTPCNKERSLIWTGKERQ